MTVAAVCMMLLATGLPLAAQDTWIQPRLIPYYDGIYAPHLLADQNQAVHAFNAEKINDRSERIILYRQWTLHQGWTQPTDIVFRRGAGTLEVIGVTKDNDDNVHLVFYDGNPPGRGDLYYTTAPLADAGRTTAWSQPIVIGKNAGPLAIGTVTSDQQGTIVVIYSGVEEGLGLYETHTFDAGKTWSSPVPFAFAYGEDVLLARTQSLLDNQGVVHAVWSELNNSSLGQSVNYARLALDQGQWSETVELARREGNDYAADWPLIAEYQGELMVIYYDGSIPNGIPPTRWMRQSGDGGRTWTEPVAPFPHVGENGFPVLLTDSDQNLHIVLANRVGTPAIGGMWHGVWQGDQWGELEAIAVRPEGTPPRNPSVQNDSAVGAASRPSAVISQGNVLLVTWWHDMSDPPPAGFSFRVLDAPELPLKALKMPQTPTPTATPTRRPDIQAPGPISQVESGPDATVLNTVQHAPGQTDTTRILLTGLAPSVALLALAALVIIRRRNAS